MKPTSRFDFVCLLIASGLISSVVSQNGTATTPACPASIQPLPSDPNAQSNTASILITSPTDGTHEFTCFAGQSSYESSGIHCHALNCPAPGYGPGYGRGPYGNPYGGAGNGPYGHSGPISIGPLVAQTETPYPCWKLKQIRLNNYVYMACFVKGYATMLYQVVFKEQGGLELNHYEAIPYTHLTSVGKGSFTAENSYQCIAAVYSSYADGCCKEENGIINPANELAPIFTICPNSYKWYFCGNVNIKNTIDVTVWWAQMTLHAIFVQLRHEKICVPTTDAAPPPPPTFNCTKYTATPLVQFAISPDIDKYVCTSRLEQEIDVIGIPPNATANTTDLYPLCGVRKTMMIANSNASVLCAAVDVDTIDGTCPPPGGPGSLPTTLTYSSFCLLFDATTNTVLSNKVVFLAGAIAATDVFFLRGNQDCCQYVATVGPGQQFLAYSLQAIITSLQTQTAPETTAAVGINPLHLFNSASSCTVSGAKCCGGSTTCLSCTRLARFGDKQLAELNCGSTITTPTSSAGYPGVIAYGDDTNTVNAMKYNNSAQVYGMPRNPYGGPGPVLYAGGGPPRPMNYSTPMVYATGGAPPQMQMQYGVPPGPYQGPPVQPPQHQQPIYGVRYGA